MARIHTEQPQHVSNSQLRRLRQLPKRQGFVLEGGRRRIEQELDTPVGPMSLTVTLWIDAGQDYVRNVVVVPSDESTTKQDEQAIACMVLACLGPFENSRPMPPRKGAESPQPSLGGVFSFLGGPTPALPERVLINDATLLRRAREIFAPAHVPVELVEQLETFDRAFEDLSTELLSASEWIPPFAEDVDAATAQRVVSALSALGERDVWNLLPDLPPVEVALGRLGPEDDVTSVFATVGENVDEDIGKGIDLFFSLADLQKMQEFASSPLFRELNEALQMLQQPGTSPLDTAPDTMEAAFSQLSGMLGTTNSADEEGQPVTTNVISATFREYDMLLSAAKQWLQEHGLAADADGMVPQFLRLAGISEPRPLSAREARATAATYEALAQFLDAHRDALEALDTDPPDEQLSHTAQIEDGGQTVSVAVTYPAPGFDMATLTDPDHVELAPATEEGRRTVYRFKVALVDYPDIWRRIELSGDQTLEDLHFAIQDAFEWDNDHLWAFYLSGKPFDNASEYGAPEGESPRYADAFRLEQLPLKKRQRILYIFDFGDEWRHQITVEAIERDAVKPDTTYPQITERQGNAIPQYPVLDEELYIEAVDADDEDEDESDKQP